MEVRIVDEDGRPLWIEHPRGRSVDVVALKMTLPLGLIAKPIDGLMEPFNENLKVAIADDVFVIGYPFGLSAGEFFPIWKRATIASEPRVEIAGLPKMLVDTASRPGMSGSPVVVYRRRPVTLIGPSPSDPARRVMSRHETRLVGIYSGRIGNEDPEFKAQLGVVWKARVIDEILSGDARIYVQT